MLKTIVALIRKHDGINDKNALAKLVGKKFSCTKDRAIYYTDSFAIRFLQTKVEGHSVSNTVLSLSTLQKYDNKPIIVCISAKRENILLLANTTFIKKLSHSSINLRIDNIVGSFNATDIFRSWGGISNIPENFEELFAIHQNFTFKENLDRIVEATNNIAPIGTKFNVALDDRMNHILQSPERTSRFIASPDYITLLDDLTTRTNAYKNEILVAACIENVRVRGTIIEYLIAGESDEVRRQLISALESRSSIPRLISRDGLGDYSKTFPDYNTETDIKTKILILTSAPKGYNLDKMLEFLSGSDTVFMLFFIGIDFVNNALKTKLISMFHPELVDNTIFQEHWAGRNSRGVSQFRGEAIKRIILEGINNIDVPKAKAFLTKIIEM